MTQRTARIATEGIDPVTETAIDWLIKLGSGHSNPTDQVSFDHWLAADARHLVAWQEVSSFLEQPVTTIQKADLATPGQRQAARLTLAAPPVSNSRRKLLRSSMAMIVLGLGTYALNRQQPLLNITADAHTGTAARRTIALEDGSTLTLNARSAVDIDINDQQRLIRLLDGDIIARVAADKARPFIVQTRDGTVRALGTQFVVSQRKHDTLVAVLEHSVMVNNTTATQMVVEEGETARFDQYGVTRLEQNQSATYASWADGVLEVRNQSLGEVINALRPYSAGYLHISPQAATLRVFGVFSLDEPEAALISLVETQPIVLRKLGPFLTWIDISHPG